MSYSSYAFKAARSARAETRLAPLFERVIGVVRGNHVSCAADQAIVSATSFAAFVLVARWTDVKELGYFALGNSVVGMLVAMQHALIATPYAIQRHHRPDCADKRAFICLAQNGVFSAVAISVMLIGTFAASAAGLAETTSVAIAVAAVVPFVLLKELAREFGLAHFSLRPVIGMDSAVGVLQLASLLVLAFSGGLSSASAIATIGLASALPAIVWFAYNRHVFGWPAGSLKELLAESWALGKWLWLSRSAILVQGYAAWWLTAVLAGAAATGIYTACASLVSFSNPILFGLYNFLTPRAALTLKEAGPEGLRKTTFSDTLVLGGLMSAFTLVIFVGAEWVLALLYPSDAYRGYGYIAVLLSVAALVSAIGIPPANALASMQRGSSMAAISTGTAALQILLLVLLLPKFGLLGAALSTLAGAVAATITRWMAFFRPGMLQRDGQPAVGSVQS